MTAVKCESLSWVSECCGWVIIVLMLFSLCEKVKIKSARIEDFAESLFGLVLRRCVVFWLPLGLCDLAIAVWLTAQIV